MDSLFRNFDLQAFILTIGVLIIAITIHEFSHAITADKLGDPTPRGQGRISLLPPDHLDPLGTIMMVITTITGFGIGWGKPVMTNPRNFAHPRIDGGKVAIAGPISNILQALVFALLYRLTFSMVLGSPIGFFMRTGVAVNLALAFFNMIPIGPLDGHWVIQAVLPSEQAARYQDWNRAYGGIVFFGAVIMAPGLISSLIMPAVLAIYRPLMSGLF
ncbi:MAG: site-2 protease family protein [Chthonomonadales bacterium]